MISVDVDLERAIPPDALNEVAYWLKFANEKIAKFDIDSNAGKSIKIWLDDSDNTDSTDTAEIARKVQLCVQNVLKQYECNEKPIVLSSFKNNKNPDANREILEQVLSANVLKPLGLADVVMGEPLVSLVRAVDCRFRELAKQFRSREYAYSHILPVDYLENLHHFDSSPQNAMFASYIVPDVEIANQFIEETVTQDGVIPRKNGFLSKINHVLSPAVCYHVYLHLKNSILDENLMITTIGRNYRYEGRNAFLLERLWDFTAREIVFIGTPNFVQDMRNQLIEEIQKILVDFELDGHIEDCNDALFLRGDRNKFELDPHPKYELRLELPYKGTQFSCGSFNVHGNVFSLRNNIRNSNGNYVWTGCVAFGLERWAWALIAQHGIDTSKWSGNLQKIVEKYQ